MYQSIFTASMRGRCTYNALQGFMQTSFILTIFILFLSLQVFAKDYIYIVDADDTIKQSNVANLVDSARRHKRGVLPFKHLIKILNLLKEAHEIKGEKVDFIYLSTAPKFIRLTSWLENSGAPEGKVYQRRVSNLIRSGKHFKMAKLVEIFAENPSYLDRHVRMFGDNNEYDPYVYTTIRDTVLRGNPSVEIYIRDIKAEATHFHSLLPVIRTSKVRYFFTEVDLVKYPQFANFGQDFFTELVQNDDDLVPDYVRENLIARAAEHDLNGREILRAYLTRHYSICYARIFNLISK